MNNPTRYRSIGSSLTMGYYTDGPRMWKQAAGSSPTFYFYGGGTVPECEFDNNGAITALHTTGANGLLSTSSPSSGGWRMHPTTLVCVTRVTPFPGPNQKSPPHGLAHEATRHR